MWNISTLSDLREAVRDSLVEGMDGVKVFDYTESRWTAPAVIVTPDGMTPVVNGEGPFGSWSAPVNVIVIGNNKGTAKVTAKELDDLTLKAIRALDEYDITEVSAPQNVSLNIGGKELFYWGVIIRLEFITKITKED